MQAKAAVENPWDIVSLTPEIKESARSIKKYINPVIPPNKSPPLFLILAHKNPPKKVEIRVIIKITVPAISSETPVK